MNGRTIVVGDIHGCYDELIELLERCSFSEADRVVAVGDLITKGPKDREVLDLFMTDERFRTVIGNHDLALPVLEKLGLPATIYITTGFLDTDTTIWAGLLQHAFTATELHAHGLVGTWGLGHRNDGYVGMACGGQHLERSLVAV